MTPLATFTPATADHAALLAERDVRMAAKATPAARNARPPPGTPTTAASTMLRPRSKAQCALMSSTIDLSLFTCPHNEGKTYRGKALIARSHTKRPHDQAQGYRGRGKPRAFKPQRWVYRGTARPSVMQRRLKSSMPRKRSPPGRPEVVSRGVTRADIQDGVPHPKQNKTGRKLAIKINGKHVRVIERITSRPAKIKSAWLIQDESRLPLTFWMQRNPFDEAREAAGATFQFRDTAPRPRRIRATLGTHRNCWGTKHGT